MGHETQIGSGWSMGSMEHVLGGRQPKGENAKDKRKSEKQIKKESEK